MPAPKKVPNPVDQEIGARIRARRVALGMSQTQLGELLGVTFQQVQKYEKGANRVGGSRLKQVSIVLSCSPGYLIGETGGAEDVMPPGVLDAMQTRDGQRMLVVFSKMPETVRKRWLHLGEAIIGGTDQNVLA